MHTMKVQAGVECYLHSYLAMALNGEWTALLSGRFSLHCISSLVFCNSDTVCLLRSTNFDVLLTVHLSIFILVINQLDVQNLFYNKFISCLYMFRAPYAHRQEVKIALYSIWYHHTCRWPSRAQVERGRWAHGARNMYRHEINLL